MCTWITQCMRCDRLASVIFRAAGSIFASRSALRRARFHTRPPAGTEPRIKRSARPAACSCASIVEARKPPLQPPESPHTDASPLPPSAALSAPGTLHSATNPPARKSPTDAPQIRSRSSTTDQKLTTAQTFRTRSSSALVHRLKLFSETTES